ncbi:MAG: 2-hydroxyglutaryl-CoA dehydratase [Candidatus Nealsonbacteria bacterium CG08_land_8_20_14_0_20_38_20]|uniref:2-hydroxyglutaryl-CoA dehydratase n=1 Tax=Candidatus Nealsonbacteria bacterium CG08_land_8_20_14_0_20_38_20 TaxID=1974705 RepID=A0A2H0YPN5_9BACT|nr:MAG: 2-hydroxyglutaryl-CoA dehydratase [Candidatus Nealsonbacteria bacterium CG08_land_8_20_14_0_20_38_20]
MKAYLGIDVGSISYKFVLIDEKNQVLFWLYKRTEGNPILAIQNGFKDLRKFIENHRGEIKIAGIATTGSGRYLAGVIAGADLVKNEITAHAKAISNFVPGVQTVIEIGGQDSKIIVLENGVAIDFAMNLICSAGTGAFLDAQAYRLGVPIEKFGELTLASKNPTTIGSRCSVFAESDMIHKQQIGHKIGDIVAGLCQGLARNYLSGVARGKKINPPIVFLGGVSENTGMRWAFEKALEQKIIVPPYNTVMGALGAAILIKTLAPSKTKFRGFDISEKDVKCASFQCRGCPNQCEVIEAKIEGKIVARWGDRCAKWSNLNPV